MKLHKALKLRKKLVGDIARLKTQIQVKNSYTVGSLDAEKYNVPKLYEELQKKISELIGLKYVINEANREIQANIYTISEYKALIAFWNEVPVKEGKQILGYSDGTTIDYYVQIDEAKRNQMVAEFQVKVDALQEEIDTFNYTTDIPWGEEEIVPKVEKQ
jgi:abortive infection bacteriophage resistance protein